jgi:choline dehydrogenase-like flavoprotein
VKDRFDVIVVGSGAGGGVVAGELAERGKDVLLLETGPHLTAVDFDRWEAKATHEFWWPIRFGLLPDGDVVAFLAGRCVGGTTTINTKVALRAHDKDVAKWHPETGLTSDGSAPFSLAELEPYYERVERRLGVRERSDWQPCVHTIEAGFRALGYELQAVTSYTDGNCMHCGSCLQGCPTNAGKSTGNTYIADAWARGLLELRANSHADRVVIEGGRATGVEVGGETVHADTVVVAGGALNTPQILRRSGLDAPSIGKFLGLHPVRLVYGLFDEPQDAHMTYPISSHFMGHQHDEDGGFVIEATTIQDPIGFATTLEDENGPLWGAPLVDALRGFRRWIGVLAMANDENNGSVSIDENGVESFAASFNERERARTDDALDFSRKVLLEAGATSVRWTGLITTHVQGTCRMGSDPERSVVDANAQSWDVKRLYVGDGSLIPHTLSVNPSLTIMALATRLAAHLDADPHGYLA